MQNLLSRILNFPPIQKRKKSRAFRCFFNPGSTSVLYLDKKTLSKSIYLIFSPKNIWLLLIYCLIFYLPGVGFFTKRPALVVCKTNACSFVRSISLKYDLLRLVSFFDFLNCFEPICKVLKQKNRSELAGFLDLFLYCRDFFCICLSHRQSPRRVGRCSG